MERLDTPGVRLLTLTGPAGRVGAIELRIVAQPAARAFLARRQSWLGAELVVRMRRAAG